MEPYDVAIAPCASYDKELCKAALTEILRPLGGLSFVKPGMQVVIKANLVSMLKPEAAATTHPVLLCALTEMLLARGAKVILGDSPGGLFTAAYVEPIYRATGMTQVEKAGAHLNRNFGKSDVVFPQAKAARTFTCTAYLQEADVIINFCKLKSHGMMNLSGAVKNLFGTIPGLTKPEYHYRFPNPQDFADMLIDLNEYFKPALSIMDGVVAMEGNGPTAGTPRPMGFVAASESPYKLDLLAASLIGLTPRQVPTITASLNRGLIPPTAGELCVFGNPAAFVTPDFQKVGRESSLRFYAASSSPIARAFGAVAEKILKPRPILKKDLCVGCSRCAGLCPAKAITMKNGLPHINRSKCIRCFCCQEFCPKGAYFLKRK